jgi:hypothetical protein
MQNVSLGCLNYSTLSDGSSNPKRTAYIEPARVQMLLFLGQR